MDPQELDYGSSLAVVEQNWTEQLEMGLAYPIEEVEDLVQRHYGNEQDERLVAVVAEKSILACHHWLDLHEECLDVT